MLSCAGSSKGQSAFGSLSCFVETFVQVRGEPPELRIEIGAEE
jgi:hypothetical protein